MKDHKELPQAKIAYEKTAIERQIAATDKNDETLRRTQGDPKGRTDQLVYEWSMVKRLRWAPAENLLIHRFARALVEGRFRNAGKAARASVNALLHLHAAKNSGDIVKDS
jgi:hypothetical protein